MQMNKVLFVDPGKPPSSILLVQMRGVSVVKQHNLVRKMLYSNNETTCFGQ